MFSIVPFFYVQDERLKPSQQFTMRFGTAMDKLSGSRNSISFSKKTEKDKSYEGLRLPLSPLGTVLWVRISFNRIGRGKRPIHIKSFKGVSRKSVSKKIHFFWIRRCCKDNFKLILLLTEVFIMFIKCKMGLIPSNSPHSRLQKHSRTSRTDWQSLNKRKSWIAQRSGSWVWALRRLRDPKPPLRTAAMMTSMGAI